MHYGTIKPYDIANGTGVRVSLFVSGCRHHCKGCFNSETWNFDYGQPFTEATHRSIIEFMKPSYYRRLLSLLGGEPFEPENQQVLAGLLKDIRKTYPDKTIWCYTGYLYDVDLIPGGKVYTPFTEEMLSCIDVLVDGEFVERLERHSPFAFRGSSNQRILHLKEIRKQA